MVCFVYNYGLETSWIKFRETLSLEEGLVGCDGTTLTQDPKHVRPNDSETMTIDNGIHTHLPTHSLYASRLALFRFPTPGTALALAQLLVSRAQYYLR